MGIGAYLNKSDRSEWTFLAGLCSISWLGLFSGGYWKVGDSRAVGKVLRIITSYDGRVAEGVWGAHDGVEFRVVVVWLHLVVGSGVL